MIMPTKAISFLGAGKYNKTKYRWGESECETDLFPEALYKIFKPSSLYIFVTERARSSARADGRPYCEVLKESVGGALNLVTIPEGRTQGELWEIFNKFTEVVEERDDLILDITHAFRSIPIFVFSAAIFLRYVKDAKIEHILYGAYEARDEKNVSPIFDLRSLMDLVDWTSGAEALIVRGDAVTLANKLKERCKGTGSAGLPTRKMAEEMLLLSKALSLVRPMDAMKASRRLTEIFELVRRESLPPPFFHILEKVKNEISRLSCSCPEILNEEWIEKGLEIIDYCIKRGMIIQGVLISREWVVDLQCMMLGKASSWLDKETREEIEKKLNEELNSGTDVSRVWGNIREIRNNIAHCGMRRYPISLERLERKAKEIPTMLRGLLYAQSGSREDPSAGASIF